MSLPAFLISLHVYSLNQLFLVSRRLCISIIILRQLSNAFFSIYFSFFSLQNTTNKANFNSCYFYYFLTGTFSRKISFTIFSEKKNKLFQVLEKIRRLLLLTHKCNTKYEYVFE